MVYYYFFIIFIVAIVVITFVINIPNNTNNTNSNNNNNNNKGKGSVSETKEVLIKIPSGIESGSVLRVRDAGNGIVVVCYCLN